MSDSIPVVFNTDNEYVVPTYVAIFSVVRNHTDPRPLDIHVLVPGDYDPANGRVLQGLADGFEGISITVDSVGDAYSRVEMGLGHLATTALYRLLIPRLLGEYDTCVYLDSDLVVEGDVAELFDQDVSGYCAAGVLDWFNYRGRDDWREHIDIPSLDGYVNSGVLVMNVREIRERGLEQALIDAGYTEGYVFNDQDALNVVCYGHLRRLPLRYNMQWVVYTGDGGPEAVERYRRKDIEDAKARPFIVHYTGVFKPWSHRGVLLAEHWWRTVELMDEKTRSELIDPYVRAHRGPLKERLIARVKAALLRCGAYGALKRHGVVEAVRSLVNLRT